MDIKIDRQEERETGKQTVTQIAREHGVQSERRCVESNEYVWKNGGQNSGFRPKRPSLKGKIIILNQYYCAYRVSKIVVYRLPLKIIHKIA